LCRQGWKQKIAGKIPEDAQSVYVDRIKKELAVLEDSGLSSYFLIVSDIVEYVRSKGWLPGPGRGSAAGCLVSYLIGITSIDPIKYNLIFERFYNAGRNTKDRISMPDIDVDVPIQYREDIIQYIKNKYGQNKVSQMITFNTLKGRGALKEVLRVYDNLSFEEMNRITKNIPDEAKIADDLQEMKDEDGEASIIRWALENNADKLKEWCFIDDNDELSGPLAKRFEQAIRLEGTKYNQSKHAAGIAICSSELDELCPMIYDTKTDQSIAGLEMSDLESIGIIKFDILGIALLDKIMEVKSLLSKTGDNHEVQSS
jgi:DNA polymerase-3 subunit alpha